MSVLTEQVWVTSAVNGEDAEKALILCYSLRRAFTSRKIAVIASPKLSLNLINALNHGFDFVFYLAENQNRTLLKLEDFAKLYSILACKSFDNCAYVSPSMLALKNCDDIFSKETDGLVLLEGDEHASLFLFKPSMDHFLALTTGLKNSMINGSGIGKYLKNWIENQFKDTKFLDGKYNNVFTGEKMLLGYEKNISMVNLVQYPEESNLGSLRRTGILAGLITNYCMKIRSDDVLPLIKLSSDIISASPPQLLGYRKEPIAIVGMSCRYPGSNNLEEFWNLLFQGEDGTSKPPSFRWLREQSPGYTADAKKTNAGFLKVPVDEFNGNFFGISPKEVLFMDPQQRILHELVWEGLEDACIDPQTLRGSPGSVFMGSWMNDYKEILIRSGNAEFYRLYMGNSIGGATARLSFLLGLTGPSIATESGCSSAMVAVHLACRSLQLGETNLALAGGVNLLLRPFDKDIMPMVISPDGHCKTFSEDANGFARAEGCGVLVLKRLSDAVKDNDNIWALIRGSAVAQEGISKSMGTPTVDCESLAMEEALSDARVRPEQVSYVEAHGTGTTVGDPMEVAAIAKAYHSPARKNPLVIGSVKTNVGHTESCSGITGIMKVVLGMHHETIPAHRNLTKINPSIDLEAIPAVIPLERMEWKKSKGNPRIAGVSSFGITGTDAHVIIEESPQILQRKVLAVGDNSDRPAHLLKISSKTEQALEMLVEKYKVKMQESQDDLASIAYSSNIGRANFPYRAVIIAKTRDDAISSIEQENYLKDEANADSVGKICFLFTGQGSQYPGMAKKLYDFSPVFQVNFDYCDKVLEKNYDISLKQVLWSSDAGSGEEINRTIYSQTSIFCVEYALLKLWESWGVKPDYALGHSLGEFAAAVCTGIISVEDAIKLVAERSKLIEKLPRGKMLVIQADYNKVDSEMRRFAADDPNKILDYAAINSCEQTVVAGDSDIVTKFSTFCTNNKLKCIELAATHAFHSKHMDPMLDEYRTVANTTTKAIRRQTCDYISGMRGDVVPMEQVGAEYWVQHTREKVNFLSASKKAIEAGCQIFIEVGPQPILSALTIMNTDTNLLCLPSLKRNEDEWETILNTVGKLYVKGIEIDWLGFDQFYNRNKVRLPHYPFIGKRFWPELMETSGNAIHPLIGSLLPNASSSKIFQNGVNLSTHTYIKDHAIGETVVFPGAGYLEMCIAAGLATMESSTDTLTKPRRPMKVENLMIKAPLALQEEKTCQLQTIVDLNKSRDNEIDWNDMSIKIFHRQEVLQGWLEHAVATFSPIPTAEEQQIIFDVKTFQETLLQPTNPQTLAQVYNNFLSIGLKFRSAFHSLEKSWENEDKSTLLFKIKVPEDADGQSGRYIVHPVVLDAMVQATLLFRLSPNAKPKLHVPIKIGKFLWLANPTSQNSDLYIHVSEKTTAGSAELSTNCISALLVDSTGKVLSLMSNVDLISTTVKAVESVLEQQTCVMPDFWEESWRPRLGPLQHRHDLSLCNKEKFYDDHFMSKMQKQFNQLNQYQQDVFNNLERFVYLNFLRCFYDCGWLPTLNDTFSEVYMMEKLGIQKGFDKLLSYILGILEEEGILQKNQPDLWLVKTLPPSLNETLKELSSPTFADDLVKGFECTLLLSEIGRNYSGMIQGRKSALPIMFPEDASNCGWPSITQFYTEYGELFGVAGMFVEVGRAIAKHCTRHVSSGERNIFRILEVGAGTGAFSHKYMEVLKESDIEFEYTFTDISPSFFASAEKRLEFFSKSITFQKLNIEEDPLSQGFTPNYFDIVIAGDVVHATRNLSETLANVGMLLRPNGQFFLIEQTRKIRVITYLFGLLDGFWRFDDHHLRPDHCTLSTGKWNETLELAGFTVVEVFSSVYNNHSFIYSTYGERQGNFGEASSNMLKYWIIFHQENSPTSQYLLQQISTIRNRRIIVVQRGEKFKTIQTEGIWKLELKPDSEQDFVKLMDFVENLCETSVEGLIYAWSLDKSCTNQEYILQPYFYMVKSVLSRKLSTTAKIVALVDGIMPIEDYGSNFSYSTIWGLTKTLKNERVDIQCRCIDIGDEDGSEAAEQVFLELWSLDKATQVAFYGNTKYISRLQPHKPALSALKLLNGLDRFHLILPETKSIADLQFDTLDPFALNESQVEIQVKTSALNFKDVLSVLKPSKEFENVDAIGFDFAGIIKRVGHNVSMWSVGDHVFGISVKGDSLPSHLQLDEKDVLPMPIGMTFAEACTLPAVGATSYHCLIEVANIVAGDVVLIHAASGGVGLSAIQICKNVGATIIATAGSTRKKNYLRSLGIKHIFHSRNTQYGNDILKVTNGRGVDVVLNSLTSKGFKEATLKACAKNARFVEMSKLSIWQPDQVKKLRPDVQYTIVDLSAMKSHEWSRIMGAVKKLADAKVVRPIPYVRFDAVHIREALEYLQKARHIGKVVCVMPDVRMQNGNSDVYTPIFNEYATYIITGGLGGIGFVVCRWMIEKGAKHIILAGRSVPSDIMIKSIDNLKAESTAKIVPVQLDVANFEGCKTLIEVKISEMGLPPLKGIMHAAGTLEDGLIENQTWEKLSSTFKTKVDGTLNLHLLTKNLNLEHFVMFSSMAATFGSPGQSNHAAGNIFEDSFAHYRQSIGLPATTINWGQWGEVGVATEIELPGVKMLSNLQATTGLEYALKSHRTQTGIFNIDSFVLLSKLLPQILRIVDEHTLKSKGNTNNMGGIQMKSEQFWLQYDILQTIAEKIDLMREKLRWFLRNILKLDHTDPLEDNTDFQEMGVDSLMFVEIKNAIQALLGNRAVINASVLTHCNTVNLLAEALIKVIEGGTLSDEKRPTKEEVSALIKEDCQLAEYITAKPNQTKICINDVSKVLLTGCSGTLGPYLIKELSGMPQVTQIICLMRPNKNVSEEERLNKILQERDLLSHVDMTKIRCIAGNVAYANLGLTPSIYKELCDSVDAVFHCAAIVQHIEYYKKRDSDKDMRAVNVGGTKNVLEFACTGKKLKQVYCASAIIAVSTIDKNNRFSEDWPDLNDFDGVTTVAYPITKFVGDVLMKQAILERGISGKVFRFPLIVGESRTGRCLVDQNHAMLRYMFILQQEMMPSNPFPLPMLPVDTCAWASVQIFFNSCANSDIYNVSNFTSGPEQEFVYVAEKLGYKVNLVEFSEFTEKIRESTLNDSPFAIFKDFYKSDEDLLSLYDTSPVLKQYILSGGSDENFLVSRKIWDVLPQFYDNVCSNVEHIYRDLLYAKSQGWFAKFNL